MTPKELFISYLTITKNEVARVLRIWPQTFLPNIITTTLYFLIFGKVIGRQIDNIEGFKYIEYIMPGLVALAVITGSYMNTVSSFFSSKFQKSIEAILASPTPYYIIALGYITGGALRGIVSGILVLIVSMFFIEIKIFSVFIVVLILCLISILFALVGLINGVMAKKFDDIHWITSFVLTPLSYLGGIFYPVTSLPGIWSKVSFLNPIFYCIDSLRYGILGIQILNFKFTLLISSLLIVLLWGVCLKLMKHKLQN